MQSPAPTAETWYIGILTYAANLDPKGEHVRECFLVTPIITNLGHIIPKSPHPSSPSSSCSSNAHHSVTLVGQAYSSAAVCLEPVVLFSGHIHQLVAGSASSNNQCYTTSLTRTSCAWCELGVQRWTLAPSMPRESFQYPRRALAT